MPVLVRRITADGQRSERSYEGALTIGRAPDCDLVLPGLLMAQKHLRLSPVSEFSLELECLSPIGVLLNGRAITEKSRVVPGDELAAGSHLLRLRLGEGARGLLLEVVERDAAEATAANARTALGEAGWRMRRPAVLMAGVVLVLGLLLPLVLWPLSLPAALRGLLPGDQLWSSGPVSSAHRQFGDDCGTCHRGLFQRVQDASCLECHAGIEHHGDDAASMADAGLDQQRCASCHLEHGDAHAVLPRHDAVCGDCHARPQQFASLKNVGVTTDFADDHPQFRVRVTQATPQGARSRLRAPLAPGLKDASLLIYPHDLHIALGGVRGPKGSEVLNCASCHRPDAAGVGFEALSFERDCQRCHELDVDFADQRLRLPHGDNATVRNLLKAAEGSRPALQVPVEAVEPEEERRRPGEQAERSNGGPAAGGTIDEVFERQVCAKCHVVQRKEGAAAAVLAPQLPKTWMPMARFNHEPHRWVRCESCHAAASTSANSDDLMLPAIETCRECHGGQDSAAQVPTTCIDCHRFHQAAQLTMDPVIAKDPSGPD